MSAASESAPPGKIEALDLLGSLATITTDDPATPPDAKALQSNSMPTTSIGASSSSPLYDAFQEYAVNVLHLVLPSDPRPLLHVGL